MTPEEKAKRYDKALAHAKLLLKIIGNATFGNLVLKNEFENMFHELAESEDERIKNEIIAFVEQSIHRGGGTPIPQEQENKWIAWLEKQGKNNMGISEATKQELKDNLHKALEKETPESWNKFLDEQSEQKLDDVDNKFIRMRETKPKDISEFLDRLTTVEQEFLWEHIAKIRELDKDEQKATDKVEPKFKNGQWITNGDYTWKIVEVKPLDYILQSQDGNIVDDTISHVDAQFHSFTVEDAKDGDVLFTSSTASYETFVFKGIDEKGNAKCYFTYDSEDGFREGTYHFIGRATNCKPATKEQRDLLFSKMKDNGYEWDAKKKELKKIEQKPACSEEQHKKESLSDIENRIINFAMQFHDNRMKPEAEWEDELKMLRDNIKIDPWSEEDELMFEESIGFIKSSPYPYAGDTLRGKISKTEAENWIKSLKNRIQPQTKQEWSEEDEKMLNDIIMCGEHHCYLDARNIAWLKYIKERYTWKPSDEQINLLEELAEDNNQRYFYTILRSLCEQLKKLKG